MEVMAITVAHEALVFLRLGQHRTVELGSTIDGAIPLRANCQEEDRMPFDRKCHDYGNIM
jgi:hypothetical protein